MTTATATEFFKPPALAARLGIDTRLVYAAIADGSLEAVRIGTGRCYIIPTEAAERYIESRTINGT